MAKGRESGNRRLQRLAKWIAIVAGLLGVLGSVGVGHLPTGLLRLEIWAVLLAAMGVAGGRFTVLRAGEIEAERWRVLEDEQLTSGEKEYAHRHAEQERRGAPSPVPRRRR